MWSIFKTFFFLGWVSFGGPAAHIGYFRRAFVEQRQWLTDSEYGQIVALSQFLPGPGSSQVGFALGYKKGGIIGAFMAFIGFTLPSALIMLVLATISSQLMETDIYTNIVHGLKLLAVVVVADATWGMYKNFCTQKLTAGICITTAFVLLVAPGITSQILILITAGLLGSQLLKGDKVLTPSKFKPSIWPLLLFVILLVVLPFFTHYSPLIYLFNGFYQAGSLVFGGGHVVVPLLQGLIGDQISQDTFLTGYAAAQAVPGPMFTLATYIGYKMSATPVLAALIATLAVFLPGFLLLLGVLKNWEVLANKPKISGAILGVNASVVGLLLSALYQPVFSSAVAAPIDIGLILVGYYLHKTLNISILWMIIFFIMSTLLGSIML